MGKKKHYRVSKALRQVRLVEAIMLGEPLPIPKIKLCDVTPTTEDELRKMDSTGLRAMAWDLNIYVPRAHFAKLRHAQIAHDVHEHISTVNLADAPGTVDGLLALGTHRLRYLAGLFIKKGNAQAYAIPKGKLDLTDEEIARRVLCDLKMHDKVNHHRFSQRLPRLRPEDLVPEKEKPPIPVKAKTARLLTQRQGYLTRILAGRRGAHPGHNSPKSNRKKLGAKKGTFGHHGSRNAEMRCGCQVRISISNTKYFWLENVIRVCAVHVDGHAAGAHHVSELKKEPGRKSPPGRAQNKQTSRRSWHR